MRNYPDKLITRHGMQIEIFLSVIFRVIKISLEQLVVLDTSVTRFDLIIIENCFFFNFVNYIYIYRAALFPIKGSLWIISLLSFSSPRDRFSLQGFFHIYRKTMVGFGGE